MITLVSFLVAHNEDTDALQDFVETTASEYASGDITMLDYAVKVDLPPCFVLAGGEKEREQIAALLSPDPWRVRTRADARERPVSTFH